MAALDTRGPSFHRPRSVPWKGAQGNVQRHSGAKGHGTARGTVGLVLSRGRARGLCAPDTPMVMLHLAIGPWRPQQAAGSSGPPGGRPDARGTGAPPGPSGSREPKPRRRVSALVVPGAEAAPRAAQAQAEESALVQVHLSLLPGGGVSRKCPTF